MWYLFHQRTNCKWATNLWHDGQVKHMATLLFTDSDSAPFFQRIAGCLGHFWGCRVAWKSLSKCFGRKELEFYPKLGGVLRLLHFTKSCSKSLSKLRSKVLSSRRSRIFSASSCLAANSKWRLKLWALGINLSFPSKLLSRCAPSADAICLISCMLMRLMLGAECKTNSTACLRTRRTGRSFCKMTRLKTLQRISKRLRRWKSRITTWSIFSGVESGGSVSRKSLVDSKRFEFWWTISKLICPRFSRNRPAASKRPARNCQERGNCFASNSSNSLSGGIWNREICLLHRPWSACGMLSFCWFTFGTVCASNALCFVLPLLGPRVPLEYVQVHFKASVPWLPSVGRSTPPWRLSKRSTAASTWMEKMETQ